MGQLALQGVARVPFARQSWPEPRQVPGQQMPEQQSPLPLQALPWPQVGARSAQAKSKLFFEQQSLS